MFPAPLIIGGIVAICALLVIIVIAVFDEMVFNDKLPAKLYVPFVVTVPASLLLALLYGLVCTLLHIPISHF